MLVSSLNSIDLFLLNKGMLLESGEINMKGILLKGVVQLYYF